MQRDTQDHWSHKRKVKTWVLNYIYIYISLILSVNTSTKRGTSPGLVAHGRSFHRQGTTNVNGLELIMMLVISLKTNKQKTLNIKNTTLKQILICFHKATIKSLTNESPALYSVDLRLFLPIVLGFCTTSSLTGSGWIPLKIKDKKQLQSVVTTGGVFIIYRCASVLKIIMTCLSQTHLCSWSVPSLQATCAGQRGWPADSAVNNVWSGAGWQLCGCRIFYQLHNCRRKLSGWHFLLPVMSRHNNKLHWLHLSHTFAVT